LSASNLKYGLRFFSSTPRRKTRTNLATRMCHWGNSLLTQFSGGTTHNIQMDVERQPTLHITSSVHFETVCKDK
jgi:hypothetical protein